ncbi:MAG: M50 family metallopeptidase [Phycisphaerae bacterium]|nr:M50 family metallopeptidase [Phycisphaerae bacterium]MDW8262189.1 M50 family metallopeptidase [Phycisphaerales bacterium]
MAWQDRPYYRDSDSGRMSPLMWLLAGSVPLFTAFGIRVRAHASLLIFIGLILLLGFGPGTTVASRVQSATLLFAVVLLHEFGHCFAARWMGGTADEIMLTPLGGMAFTLAPRRWWPQLVTVAGGPLVNVGICLLCGVGLFAIFGFFPLGPYHFGQAYGRVNSAGWLQLGGYLFWCYTISYALLLFNLLPVWPLDGGQLLQSILWKYMGYYRSMLAATTIGIVGAAILIVAGIATFSSMFGGLLLILIALFCLMNSLQMRRMLLAEGPWAFQEEDSVDYTESLQPERRRGKWLARRRMRKMRKQARAEALERQRVDMILAKVSAKGMQSLTWLERRTLRKATEHQRQRDADLRRG